MNATFAPTSRNPAPVSDSATSSGRPPYASATSASKAGCGPIPLACAASTADDREHRRGDHQADDDQHRDDAQHATARLAQRGRELSQRLQPRERQPRGGEPRRRLGPALRRHVLEAGPERNPVKLGHLGQDDPDQHPLANDRGDPHRQRHARQLAHADPVQRAQQQQGDHGQHRDLVRERTDRRDVVQRRHDRDGDGEQVGADHQRARDDADARAEGLARGRHPAPALRVAAGDLQVSERDEHEGDRGHQHEHRRQAADLGVEDRRDVVDRRPQVGEHDRPGQRGAQVADAAAGGLVQFDFGSGAAARGVFRHQWGRSFHPSPASAQLDEGKQRIRHPKQPIRFLAGGNFEPPTRPKHAFHLKARPSSGRLQTLNAQRSRDVARHPVRSETTRLRPSHRQPDRHHRRRQRPPGRHAVGDRHHAGAVLRRDAPPAERAALGRA